MAIPSEPELEPGDRVLYSGDWYTVQTIYYDEDENDRMLDAARDGQVHTFPFGVVTRWEKA